MAAKVDIYWPRADIIEDDGSAAELKVEEGYTKLLFAIRKVREWQEEYGERLREPRLEVRGENGRLKYMIHITGK